jgi:hypothetical protein
MRLLDMAWPVLPEQGVATGHNVVACYGREGGTMTIDAGVEAFTDFNGCGKIRVRQDTVGVHAAGRGGHNSAPR